jgi:hypothetical protein
MTVKELIAVLEQNDPNALVAVSLHSDWTTYVEAEDRDMWKAQGEEFVYYSDMTYGQRKMSPVKCVLIAA